ncbi:hypothetical protein RND81_12G175200 [Saponaria officinalis]|uniref:Uncharacterized protein n=1 Tax=Saponaria officinalis TaxID=3572 RepID=A0AAW1HC51_SAPOF
MRNIQSSSLSFLWFPPLPFPAPYVLAAMAPSIFSSLTLVMDMCLSSLKIRLYTLFILTIGSSISKLVRMLPYLESKPIKNWCTFSSSRSFAIEAAAPQVWSSKMEDSYTDCEINEIRDI